MARSICAQEWYTLNRRDGRQQPRNGIQRIIQPDQSRRFRQQHGDSYPATVFSDVKTFNYVPKAASGYIDTANMLHAPKIDIMGTSRPQGKGPDRGALEVGSSTTTTTSGSTTTTAKFLTAP